MITNDNNDNHNSGRTNNERNDRNGRAVAGQLWRSSLPEIKDAGYNAVVNFRVGVERQEETTLLNVRHTGTFKSGRPHRQTTAALMASRVDAARSGAMWINGV